MHKDAFGIFIALAILLLQTGCSSIQRHTASQELHSQNELKPFSSDGCSAFFDGIPLFDSKRWKSCCVKHDISYWQGGTTEERWEADRNLRACVTEAGDPSIAEAMYLAVRAGGMDRLPLTWRWGYGWKIDRGTAPLSEDEIAQVVAQAASIPANLNDVQVTPPGTLPPRASINGDYCVDMAMRQIALKLGHDTHATISEDVTTEYGNGFVRSLSIRTQECNQPFHFRFLETKRNACTTIANEILARGRNRILSISMPNCQ